MRVRLVGRGHSWTKKSLCTSFVVDEKILVDVPQGSFKKLYFTTNIENVHTIIITHMHSDHWFDLHVIGCIITHRASTDKVVIYGPRKLKKALELQYKIGETSYIYNRLKSRVIFKTLRDGAEYTLPGYKMKAYKVEHCGIDAYGVVIRDSETSVGFTGDATLCEGVNGIVKDSSLVFIDSSNLYVDSKEHMSIRDFEHYRDVYPDKYFVPVHMSDNVVEYLEHNGIEVKEGHVYDTKKLMSNK